MPTITRVQQENPSFLLEDHEICIVGLIFLVPKGVLWFTSLSYKLLKTIIEQTWNLKSNAKVKFFILKLILLWKNQDIESDRDSDHCWFSFKKWKYRKVLMFITVQHQTLAGLSKEQRISIFQQTQRTGWKFTNIFISMGLDFRLFKIIIIPLSLFPPSKPSHSHPLLSIRIRTLFFNYLEHLVIF